MLASLLENIKLQAVPPWWTIRGLVFRARLLKIRGWRYWAPLLILLFFIYVVLLYNTYRQGAGISVTDLFRVSVNALTNPGTMPDTVSNVVALISILIGILTVIGTVWRGITAFGVKPAALLAGMSQSVSIRTLEASTSFRQRFAAEFNDVTHAMGRRSLLIFIDDLDRCRPENVLETLEAVNFLTTSGECFVVIGMARPYVQRCVGQAFKNIAEEIIDDEDVPTQANLDEYSEQTRKKKRHEFARLYLDKLFNIEVRVPTIDKEQALKLLLKDVNQVKSLMPLSGWQQIRTVPLNLIGRHWRVLITTFMFATLCVAGYYLALSLIPDSRPAQPLAGEDSKIATQNADRVSSPTPELNEDRPAPQSVTGPSPFWTPLPLRDNSNQRAELTSPASGGLARFVLPLLGLLGLIWLGVVLLIRRPEVIVKDSPNFVEALKIWQSVIFFRHSTPRSTKRFMNYVRYLAMRQRSPTEKRSLLRDFFNVKQRHIESNAGATDIDDQFVPDEALVALAALQDAFPEWLRSDQAFIWPHRTESNGLEWNLADQARQAHEKRFGSSKILQFRKRFLQMSDRCELS